MSESIDQQNLITTTQVELRRKNGDLTRMPAGLILEFQGSSYFSKQLNENFEIPDEAFKEGRVLPASSPLEKELGILKKDSSMEAQVKSVTAWLKEQDAEKNIPPQSSKAYLQRSTFVLLRRIERSAPQMEAKKKPDWLKELQDLQTQTRKPVRLLSK